MEIKNWYYATPGGVKCGPVNEDELRKLLISPRLNREEVLVWMEGMADWMPATTIEFLCPSSPPPVPSSMPRPVSGLATSPVAKPDPAIRAKEVVDGYRKAAESGDAEAQNKLALCYDKGDGVAQDRVEAVKWFRRAAEQGHARAQRNLGMCYENGEGVAIDLTEAIKWYRVAAEQHLPGAQISIEKVQSKLAAQSCGTSVSKSEASLEPTAEPVSESAPEPVSEASPAGASTKKGCGILVLVIIGIIVLPALLGVAFTAVAALLPWVIALGVGGFILWCFGSDEWKNIFRR